MLMQVGYIDGKELTLACQKEHKVLEYNCDDHRNLDLRSSDKTDMASVYMMAAKGYVRSNQSLYHLMHEAVVHQDHLQQKYNFSQG
jgi:hypothetical protein